MSIVQYADTLVSHVPRFFFKLFINFSLYQYYRSLSSKLCIITDNGIIGA